MTPDDPEKTPPPEPAGSAGAGPALAPLPPGVSDFLQRIEAARRATASEHAAGATEGASEGTASAGSPSGVHAFRHFQTPVPESAQQAACTHLKRVRPNRGTRQLECESCGLTLDPFTWVLDLATREGNALSLFTRYSELAEQRNADAQALHRQINTATARLAATNGQITTALIELKRLDEDAEVARAQLGTLRSQLESLKLERDQVGRQVLAMREELARARAVPAGSAAPHGSPHVAIDHDDDAPLPLPAQRA